jgi:hypothetical protein
MIKANPESDTAIDWTRRQILAVRILAGFEIALIAATFPLWTGNHSFPVIPLIAGINLSAIVDHCVVGALLAACAYIVTAFKISHRDIIVCSVALTAAIVLFVLNQQRLQAWHWLFVLGLVTSFFRPETGVKLLRSVLASVYVCSALSRFGPTAHHGMSASIVDQLLRMMHINPEIANGQIGDILCHALNIAELAVGIMLILPRSRRFGILSAMLLHGTLLLALGPLGLRHHWAVLIWNLCFLCLLPVVITGNITELKATVPKPEWGYRFAAIFVWMFPLSGLVGVADNWPAWQLYSTRPETWTLQVHEQDVASLPESVRPHITSPLPFEDWVFVKLDRWSLAETESPMYPEDRYQCEVIRRVISALPDDANFHIAISEPEHWRWWTRNSRTLTHRDELNAE